MLIIYFLKCDLKLTLDVYIITDNTQGIPIKITVLYFHN